jgi:hypothetical protein
MDLTPRQAFPYGHPDFAPAANPAKLNLHIGRHQGIPVESAEQASRIWQLYRESLNLGGSESPKVLLKHQGQTVGYVSYNGRVWKGNPTKLNNEMVAEAASRPTSLQVGDWIPVEDMERGTMKLVKVVAVWPKDGGAVSFDIRPGERIYYHPHRMHPRYFTNIILA